MEAGPLPPLPGIDTAAGMATAMGNGALYRRLLLRFRDSQGDFASAFAAARAEADTTAATRSAHTLKGMAGNIGARALAAATQELESACAGGAPPERIDLLLADVALQLAPVLAGLRQLDGGVPPIPAPGAPGTVAAQPALDRQHLQQRSAELKELLSDSDSEAVDLWQRQADLFKAGYPRHWRRIEAGLSDLDLDGALAALEEAMQA
jgi:HPt (histidine-containing phosphotransfer) domain-containing protein